MSSGRLILTPPAAAGDLTLDETTARLNSVGLIGSPYRQRQFLVGERFLQLITFMGCSPYLQLEPADDGSDHFCHISLHGPYAQTRLRYAGNSRPPRCPHCRRRISQFTPRMPAWSKQMDDQQLTCPLCRQLLPARALDWGNQAGTGRLFIEITEVFPGEAVPVPELLQGLSAGGEPGHYFYLFDAG